MDTTPEAQRADRRIEFARSSTDRMLLGVCGGVARRYGVDAYVVRIALLLLTLTGGLGVVLTRLGVDTDDRCCGRKWRLVDDGAQHRSVAG
jgi:phage shock protein PspC (stress-responsive transcriptional regulator)